MEPWLHAAAHDAALLSDFETVCSFGGRMSGSGQDDAAMEWAMGRARQAASTAQVLTVPYDGWRCEQASLELLGAARQPLACRPLLRSASTPAGGLELEVVDAGAGRPDDFARLGAAARDRAVLVRHEYPFTGDHVHRRRKYDMAVEAGAAAFLIANNVAGQGVLSGSSGRPRGGAGIPAMYIDHEGGAALAAACAAGAARVRIVARGIEIDGARASVGIAEIAGGRGGVIVISAHMDGHDLGTSALDNGTGVAAALAAFRALSARVGPDTPSLRLCFFCAEEWALTGSARYLADLAPVERARIKLDINLDTVAGDAALTALISDFPALAPVVQAAAEASGVPVATWLPLMPNSDHANFARHGIPALRLLAGFGKPESRVNNILSAGDVPGIIEEAELRQAVAVTCAMADAALRMSDAQLESLASR
jgi:Zn-dependent M28 family amino/carboxypeptidase